MEIFIIKVGLPLRRVQVCLLVRTHLGKTYIKKKNLIGRTTKRVGGCYEPLSH